MRRLEAEGNVVITQPGETATGNSGTYDLVGGKMVLLGDVVLTRNKNVVRGDRLDVDRNTGVSVVTSARPRLPAAGATSGCAPCSCPSRQPPKP